MCFCLAPGMFLIPVRYCSCVWGLVLRFSFCILAPGVFSAPVEFVVVVVSCLLVLVGLCL